MVFAQHVVGVKYFPGGYVGVDLFFVISGFLITTLLSKEYEVSGRLSLSGFYLRRVRRIWPVLIVVLIASWFALHSAPFDPEYYGNSVMGIFGAATGTVNWLRAFRISDGGIVGHTWSLAVEEQFYLLWPVALLFLLKQNAAYHKTILALCIVSVGFWRVLVFNATEDAERTYNALDTHSEAILCGCLAASLGYVHAARILWIPAVVFLAVVLIFFPHYSPIMQYGGFSAVAISSVAIVVACVQQTRLREILSHPALIWVGKRSYSLYLVHFPLNQVAIVLSLPTAMRILLVFVLSIIVSDLLYRVVERPMLRMGKANRELT